MNESVLKQGDRVKLAKPLNDWETSAIFVLIDNPIDHWTAKGNCPVDIQYECNSFLKPIQRVDLSELAPCESITI